LGHHQRKVFTCNIQHDRRRGRKDGRLKKETASTDVVFQSFRLDLKQPPHRHRQRPNPTRRQGAAMVWQHPRPTAASRGAIQEKFQEKPI
jgi:hypothetical protein